jgi:hypothetical protein
MICRRRRCRSGKQLRGPESGGEADALIQIPTTPLKSTALAVRRAEGGAALKARLPCGIELTVSAGTDVQWFALPRSHAMLARCTVSSFDISIGCHWLASLPGGTPNSPLTDRLMTTAPHLLGSPPALTNRMSQREKSTATGATQTG